LQAQVIEEVGLQSLYDMAAIPYQVVTIRGVRVPILDRRGFLHMLTFKVRAQPETMYKAGSSFSFLYLDTDSRRRTSKSTFLSSRSPTQRPDARSRRPSRAQPFPTRRARTPPRFFRVGWRVSRRPRASAARTVPASEAQRGLAHRDSARRGSVRRGSSARLASVRPRSARTRRWPVRPHMRSPVRLARATATVEVLAYLVVWMVAGISRKHNGPKINWEPLDDLL
jgi:hypothetical protein